MGTECHGFRVFRTELFQNLCPENTSRSHLCNFHEIVLALIPEEGQTFCESIDRKSCFFAATDIFHTVCQSVTDFQVAGSAAFLDMVSGNGDTVELRHIFRCIFENITDNTHGHSRRINVGVTNHEFFQDIVLNRTGENLFIYALFESGGDEECQNRKYGTVHCHGNGHLVQRDTCEKNVHIEHGANGNACFTYVADNTGVIRIIAAVCREVECNGQPFLACCQVSAVKCVRFFCCGEPCILTYCPGTEYVHGGVRSAQERRDTAHKVQMVAAVIYIFCIKRSYGDTFHGHFIKIVIGLARCFFQTLFPFIIRTMGMFFQVNFCKIRIHCHVILPPLP